MTSKQCGHDMTMGDPKWLANMLKRQTIKVQLTYNGLKTSKQCGHDMTMGYPN
jgi:hypothetical protein